MRRIPIRQILKWAGYPAFFLFCFVFFSYQTFPYERLRDHLVEEAGERGYELEIIDLDNSWMSGITLEGVRLVLPEEDGSPAVDVIVDELTVSTSFFSLFFETKSFSFDIELAGGEADGDIALGKDNMEVEADFEDIDLKAIPALRRFTKVPMTGTLAGELELVMPSEVRESTGNVEITIIGLSIGDGKTKLEIPGWGGLTLDQADAGNLELLAKVEEGIAKIEKAEAHGKDLALDAVGTVRLSRPLKRSQLELLFRVKIEDAYKERSSKVATMLELASTDPSFKAAQTADGAMQYKLSGSLQGRLRPQGAGGQPFKAAN